MLSQLKITISNTPPRLYAKMHRWGLTKILGNCKPNERIFFKFVNTKVVFAS